MISKKQIIGIYRKKAKNYDKESKLYKLLGFNLGEYCKKSIEELKLKKGDTVIELACGTGRIFDLLQKAVGSKGKIIGVDMSDDMLKEAKKRIKANRWKNIKLVKSDMAKYRFPKCDGIISICALNYSPEYDSIIKKGSKALRKGKRFVVFDLKFPSGVFSVFTPIFMLFTISYGNDKEYLSRTAWKSLKRYFRRSRMKEYYLGFAFIAWGEI